MGEREEDAAQGPCLATSAPAILARQRSLEVNEEDECPAFDTSLSATGAGSLELSCASTDSRRKPCRSEPGLRSPRKPIRSEVIIDRSILVRPHRRRTRQGGQNESDNVNLSAVPEVSGGASANTAISFR